MNNKIFFTNKRLKRGKGKLFLNIISFFLIFGCFHFCVWLFARIVSSIQNLIWLRWFKNEEKPNRNSLIFWQQYIWFGHIWGQMATMILRSKMLLSNPFIMSQMARLPSKQSFLASNIKSNNNNIIINNNNNNINNCNNIKNNSYKNGFCSKRRFLPRMKRVIDFRTMAELEKIANFLVRSLKCFIKKPNFSALNWKTQFSWSRSIAAVPNFFLIAYPAPKAEKRKLTVTRPGKSWRHVMAFLLAILV